VHEFVKISLSVHRNKKGWRALVYRSPLWITHGAISRPPQTTLGLPNPLCL